MKKTIRDVDVCGKRILLRADFNVPLKNATVADDTRIRKTLPTLHYLRDQGARTIVCSHLGRPNGQFVEKFKLDPVADRLSALLGTQVIKLDDTVDGEVSHAVEQLEKGQFLMLENTRYHPGEKENQPEFARKLASLADIYVNDGFGAAHRAHASTEGVARYLPAVAGLLMASEIHALQKILQQPKRPFAAILGGAKVSGKILVLNRFLDALDVDLILIGGGMANIFLKAKGAEIGKSKIEEEHVATAEKILAKAGSRISLPVDVVAADGFDPKASIKTIAVEEGLSSDWQIMDIGPETVVRFKNALEPVKMVVWNGPLGVSEMEPFAEGTLAMAKTVSDLNAVTVVGGGDTAAAVSSAGVADKMMHVSTGGGAFLNFLEGRQLPGIAALAENDPFV